ncbi:hypothetical protein [Chlamydia poikilotherma]|uniref:hypothetical protein n=1 Tax=Chlamydia poikilotherma TaxID=1967783 RepID=UPI002691F3CD
MAEPPSTLIAPPAFLEELLENMTLTFPLKMMAGVEFSFGCSATLLLTALTSPSTFGSELTSAVTTSISGAPISEDILKRLAVASDSETIVEAPPPGTPPPG